MNKKQYIALQFQSQVLQRQENSELKLLLKPSPPVHTEARSDGYRVLQIAQAY